MRGVANEGIPSGMPEADAEVVHEVMNMCRLPAVSPSPEPSPPRGEGIVHEFYGGTPYERTSVRRTAPISIATPGSIGTFSPGDSTWRFTMVPLAESRSSMVSGLLPESRA